MKKFKMVWILITIFIVGVSSSICQASGECILGWIKLGADRATVDKIYGKPVCVDVYKQIYRYGDSLYVAYHMPKDVLKALDAGTYYCEVKDVISTANNGIKTGSGLSVGDPITKFTSTFSSGIRTTIVNQNDEPIGYAYESNSWNGDYGSLTNPPAKPTATLILIFDPKTKIITKIHTSFRYPDIMQKHYLSALSGDRPTANTPFDGIGFYRIIEKNNPNNLPYGGGNFSK